VLANAGDISDFNGDGLSDLAIGSPGDVENRAIGEVLVIYADPLGGLDPLTSQVWTQDSPGVRGVSEDWDHFGAGVVTGDFNGDGFSDLAISAPGETLGVGTSGAGAVNVLYGGPNGLTAVDDQLFHQNTPGVLGTAELEDSFGRSMATGDLNADGFSDLVIGVPYESVSGTAGPCGAFHVLYGSMGGLTTVGDQLIYQNVAGVQGTSESGDWFGASLALGDINNDGADDLAVGIPGEGLYGVDRAGAVQIFFGSVGVGLTTIGDYYISQASPGMAGLEADAEFGHKVVFGDFSDDDWDDLVVTEIFRRHPQEWGTISQPTGMVTVIPSQDPAGLVTNESFSFHESSPLFPGVSDDDNFGYSLVADNFDGVYGDDLAVGVPNRNVAFFTDAGGVSVIYSDFFGLDLLSVQHLSQDLPNVADGPANLEAFGSSLTSGRYDSDGTADLAIATEHNWVQDMFCGSVNVLYGAEPAGSQYLHPNLAAIPGACSNLLHFGAIDGRKDWIF